MDHGFRTEQRSAWALYIVSHPYLSTFPSPTTGKYSCEQLHSKNSIILAFIFTYVIAFTKILHLLIWIVVAVYCPLIVA